MTLQPNAVEKRLDEDLGNALDQTLADMVLGIGGTPAARPAAPAPVAVPLRSRLAPLATTSATGSSVATELSRFLEIGERLFEDQRRRITSTESANELERVKLIDVYRVKLLDLEHEAGEALRAFDTKVATTMDALRRDLETIKARMR